MNVIRTAQFSSETRCFCASKRYVLYGERKRKSFTTVRARLRPVYDTYKVRRIESVHVNLTKYLSINIKETFRGGKQRIIRCQLQSLAPSAWLDRCPVAGYQWITRAAKKFDASTSLGKNRRA
jgi:hypothetical protein